MGFIYDKDNSKHGRASFSSPRDRQIRAANAALSAASVSELKNQIDELNKKLVEQEPKSCGSYTEEEVNKIVEEAINNNVSGYIIKISELEHKITLLETLLSEKTNSIESLNGYINNLTSIINSGKKDSPYSTTDEGRPDIKSVYIDPSSNSDENVEAFINIENENKANISSNVSKLKNILGGKSK